MDMSKQYKGGPFGSADGRVPEGGGGRGWVGDSSDFVLLDNFQLFDNFGRHRSELVCCTVIRRTILIRNQNFPRKLT